MPEIVALPDGCVHIDWAVHDQFATWSSPPGQEQAHQAGRAVDVGAQGLVFADSPHLCQIIDGAELWAVALAPISPPSTEGEARGKRR